MDTLTIIRTAADSISEGSWCQGRLFSLVNPGKSCGIGHLLRAVGVKSEPELLKEDTTYGHPLIQDALKELAADISNEGRDPVSKVWRFNDKVATRADHVREQFMKTVARLEARQVGV